MKITVLAAMTMAAYAAPHAPDLTYHVDVCPEFVAGSEYRLAYGSTTQMFARIGVKLMWHDGRCPAGALQIGFSNQTPAGLQPGALAYALPYEGTHIVVFLDRVRAAVDRPRVPALLAHVFAHEITHILQGTGSHSSSGLMKAHWEAADYREMGRGALPFTAGDVDLIVSGLAGRER